MSVDAASELLALIDRALWVVTAAAGERRGGLVATFVSEASIVPSMPRVLVGIGRRHHTRALIEESGTMALHLLGREQVEWGWRFGLQSGRDANKFEGLNVRSGVTGSPILPEAIGWLECRVENRMATGDRTIYLAEVVDAHVTCGVSPLTFRQFLELTPPEKLERLRQLMAQDRAADAKAIREWREHIRGNNKPERRGYDDQRSE